MERSRAKHIIALAIALGSGTATGIEAEHNILTNCIDGNGVQSSQMAYYPGGIISTPQVVAIVGTTKGETADWEGGQVSAVFPDKDTFTSDITMPWKNTQGGYAGPGKNDFGPFNCYNNYQKDVYTMSGTTCTQIYDCNHSATSVPSSTTPLVPSSTTTQVPIAPSTTFTTVTTTQQAVQPPPNNPTTVPVQPDTTTTVEQSPRVIATLEGTSIQATDIPGGATVSSMSTSFGSTTTLVSSTMSTISSPNTIPSATSTNSPANQPDKLGHPAEIAAIVAPLLAVVGASATLGRWLWKRHVRYTRVSTT